MNLHEAANYFMETEEINEVSSVTIPDYKVVKRGKTFFGYEMVRLIFKSKGEKYIVSIDKEGSNWYVAFTRGDESNYEIAGKFDFSVVPSVMGAIKDYFDKTPDQEKPTSMSFHAKREEGESPEDLSKRGRVYNAIIKRNFPDARIESGTGEHANSVFVFFDKDTMPKNFAHRKSK